jgi:hypothetical protein
MSLCSKGHGVLDHDAPLCTFKVVLDIALVHARLFIVHHVHEELHEWGWQEGRER